MLELLLAREDDRRPILEEGLSLESALSQPRPAVGQMPTHLWDTGGDPNDLAAQRWGVVVPEGPSGDRLLSLIEPLRKLREEEQGASVRVYRAPPNLDAPTAARWKSQVLHDEAVPEADQPRYLLLLGDLDVLSLELQQVLGSTGFIGRLAFSDDAGFEAYVEKVLRWEKKPSTAAARALFYTAHDGTTATTTGYQALIAPSLKACRERQGLRDFPARDIVEIGSQEDWAMERLLEQAASPEPSLLFSLSHGLGAPRQGWRSADEKYALQGAMSLGAGQPLDASVMANRPFLPGGLWFYLACFGAGTPSRSAFHTWLSQLRDAGQFDGRLDQLLTSLPRANERPFVAALPKAALANPQGPLAVLGHMDLAWTYSFQDPGRTVKSRPSRFMGLMRAMVAGHRAGVGLSALLRFFSEANVELTALYDQEEEARTAGRANPVKLSQRAHLWMLRQDLAGYVLLGDPAAHLPVTPVTAQPSVQSMTSEALATSLIGVPVAASVPLPSAQIMAEAVVAMISGEESPKDIAARVGVSLKQLRDWERIYKEAGQAALAQLRTRG
jgi:hypothetical protein